MSDSPAPPQPSGPPGGVSVDEFLSRQSTSIPKAILRQAKDNPDYVEIFPWPPGPDCGCGGTGRPIRVPRSAIQVVFPCEPYCSDSRYKIAAIQFRKEFQMKAEDLIDFISTSD